MCGRGSGLCSPVRCSLCSPVRCKGGCSPGIALWVRLSSTAGPFKYGYGLSGSQTQSQRATRSIWPISLMSTSVPSLLFGIYDRGENGSATMGEICRLNVVIYVWCWRTGLGICSSCSDTDFREMRFTSATCICSFSCFPIVNTTWWQFVIFRMRPNRN